MAGKKGKIWMEKAYELGKQLGSWTAIEVGTPADEEWGRYFDDIGFTPHVIRMKRSSLIPTAYTMPVALPSNLPAGWEPLGPKQRSWSY